MNVIETEFDGVLRLVPQRHSDERGSFVCTFEAGWDEAIGAPLVRWGQTSNARTGTLRGLHAQAGLGKLVRVAHGAVYDVVVDLRQGSATYGHWLGFELTGDSGESLWIPGGCAHGYLTLCPNTTVHYGFTGGHVPADERGVAWDDPALGIQWPMPPMVMSERDRSGWPPLPLNAAAPHRGLRRQGDTRQLNSQNHEVEQVALDADGEQPAQRDGRTASNRHRDN